MCMICRCPVINLKSHFNNAHPAESSTYFDFLAWSRAKKFQLMLNPTITLQEIQSSSPDKIVNLFQERGITVSNQNFIKI